MSKAYPIWNQVDACIYKSDKSFGAKDTSKIDILVGSSKSNSHRLAQVITTKRKKVDEKGIERWVFKFSVDGEVLKEMWFEDNRGRPGVMIEERDILDELIGNQEEVA